MGRRHSPARQKGRSSRTMSHFALSFARSRNICGSPGVQEALNISLNLKWCMRIESAYRFKLEAKDDVTRCHMGASELRKKQYN